VQAVNQVGEGAPSDELDRVIVMDIADAPELAIGNYTDTTVPLTWEPPDNLGGSEITQWIVRYTVRGKRIAIDTQSLEREFVLGGGLGSPASMPLESGVELTDITVQAVTADVGPGMESEPLSVTPYVVAGDPTGLDVIKERITTSAIPIRWDAPVDGYEGDIVGYKVQYTIGDETFVIDTGNTDERFVIGSAQWSSRSACAPSPLLAFLRTPFALRRSARSASRRRAPPASARSRRRRRCLPGTRPRTTEARRSRRTS